MMTIQRLAAGLLDIAMLVLAIIGLVIVLSVLLRPMPFGWHVFTMHAFFWLLPFTALLMLLHLVALAMSDTTE